MAIDINETSTAQNSSDWKEAKVPATQGNVVETVKAYNRQVRTRYYDKQQSTNDINALQKSLYYLVKALDADNVVTDSARTETFDDVELKHTAITSTTSLSTDTTNSKSFNVAGLIQKVNIIADLLSGSTSVSDEVWTEGSHGNNVGQDNKATFTPVIGKARPNDDDNYKAVLTLDSDGNKIVDISGLTTANGTHEDENSLASTSTGKKDPDTEELYPDDISGNVVLSEKEVATMVSQAVFTVLGAYDYQISSMLGYLLYTSDDLPLSFQYVLKHTQDTGIQKAPLYATWNSADSVYYIRDLNGVNSNGETKDWNFAGTTLTDDNWKIAVNDTYTTFSVYYKKATATSFEDTPVYTIPIKQFEVTVDVQHNESGDNTTPVVTVPFSTSATVSTTNQVYNNGKISFNVPQGSTYTFTVPTNVKVVHSSLSSDEYTFDSTTHIVSCIKQAVEDNDFSSNYYTVTLNNNANGTETSTTQVFEGQDASISTGTWEGHHIVGVSAGCTLNTELTTVSYANVTSDITSNLIWELDDITVQIDSDGDSSVNSNVTVKYDSSYELGDGDTVTGYDFTGWEIVTE